MNILIVEDEKHNAIRLQQLVTELSDAYHIVAMVNSVEETVLWIKNNAKPDVALMDIRLSDGLSFDIFQQTTVDFPVVFTTAYDEYAIRAFKVNSLDYLLKPIQKDELAAALKKTNINASQPNMGQLLELMNNKTKIYRKRFLLPAFDGFKTINTNDIAFVYFEHKSTWLMLSSGQEETLSYSLDDLEDELNPDDFFRANRQFIIHINSIERILNSFNGKLKVVLKKYPEKEVLVSKEKAMKFKEWLNR